MFREAWLLAFVPLMELACSPSEAPASHEAKSPPAAASSAKPDPLPPVSPGATTLRRSAVRAALRRGLGAFLSHFVIDEQPAMVAGKFHGFRIAALAGDPGYLRGVDVRPGDVVTRVNGMPIEHPEEALVAFQSLDVASELRVDLERDGAPRELHFPIVDDDGR